MLTPDAEIPASTSRWLLPASTVTALILCYAPNLRGLVEQWAGDEDMGHGFVVPFVVAWVIWRERERWRPHLGAPDARGFLVMAAGAALHLAGALGAGAFAATLGFLVSAAGAVIALRGFGLAKAWTFPFVLSLFMLPKLAFLYNQTTLPLQLLASRLAASGLSTVGWGVLREGNILTVAGHSVAVEEACSGIRFLLPLGFMALVYSYVAGGRPWMRALMVAFAIPLAVGANAFRVGLSAAFPALAEGAPHQAIGWGLFIVCLGALGLLQWLLNHAARMASGGRS